MQQGWPKKVFIYTDGASRGNPGPSALGVHIVDDNGHVYAQIGERLGRQTNNFAEYAAVARGLEVALAHQVRQITLRSDSQLLIRQLGGKYNVKARNLVPLFHECKNLLQQFDHFKLEHIRRELNKKADSLANKALDQDLSLVKEQKA